MAGLRRSRAASPLRASPSKIGHEAKLVVSVLLLSVALTVRIEAQSKETLFSPDKSYSVELIAGGDEKDANLVVSRGENCDCQNASLWIVSRRTLES
jgi:hypothetical protein